MTAIVLAGHGSSVSSETGGLVRRAADLLREWNVADEVATAFWKEPPSFASVADSLESKKIIVVPVFAARGYFVDTVLPRELAKGRKDVEYVVTPPMGEHSWVAQLVEECALYGLSAIDDFKAAVMVVGHGTPKHPNSRAQTQRIVERLREKRNANPSFQEQGVFQEVFEAFLDDEPSIKDALAACRSSSVVVVPNFIALSMHVARDVPKAIGFSDDAVWTDGKLDQIVEGRRIAYTVPGITPVDVAYMANKLATEAGSTR